VQPEDGDYFSSSLPSGNGSKNIYSKLFPARSGEFISARLSILSEPPLDEWRTPHKAGVGRFRFGHIQTFERC
jgi:hypothetical protein